MGVFLCVILLAWLRVLVNLFGLLCSDWTETWFVRRNHKKQGLFTSLPIRLLPSLLLLYFPPFLSRLPCFDFIGMFLFYIFLILHVLSETLVCMVKHCFLFFYASYIKRCCSYVYFFPCSDFVQLKINQNVASYVLIPIVTETSLHLFEEQLDLLMCVCVLTLNWTKEINFTVNLNNIE